VTLLLVITIDVEAPQSPLRTSLCKTDLFDPTINGQPFGYSMILRTLNEFGLRGVFFVNVYEAALWGDHAVQTICQKIANAGQEVALHTHPEWCYDSRRIHMWQYSAEEQAQIVADGLEMLQRWLPDYEIIVHRAGAYGLDTNTLLALKKNGILIDSSMFFQHPNCKLVWSRNQVVARDGILEIPITGFFREEVIKFGDVPLRRRISFVKTDIDAASLEELKFFVQEAKKHKVKVMNLFLHTYSFIRWSADFSHFEPDHQDIEKFRHFLEYATADPTIRFVTMRELYELYRRDRGSLLDGSDYVPIYRVEVSLIDKARRKFLGVVGK